MIKFIVLSDLHIVPAGQLSNGLDTNARMISAIEHINFNHSDAAFCVVAGDLTDNGEIEAYRRLQRSLGALAIPYNLILGNHDNRDNFSKVFGINESGTTDQIIDMNEHRIILLDTLDQGRVGGVLTSRQLDWLSARLMESCDRPVIVILHHNFVKFGTAMDTAILSNSESFIQILKRHPNIQQIISGHVHLNASGSVQGIPFTTIAGSHYNIAPRLKQIDDHTPSVRKEGPGQYGVVLASKKQVVVHFENHIDRHLELPRELFFS